MWRFSSESHNPSKGERILSIRDSPIIQQRQNFFFLYLQQKYSQRERRANEVINIFSPESLGEQSADVENTSKELVWKYLARKKQRTGRASDYVVSSI